MAVLTLREAAKQSIVFDGVSVCDCVSVCPCNNWKTIGQKSMQLDTNVRYMVPARISDYILEIGLFDV